MGCVRLVGTMPSLQLSSPGAESLSSVVESGAGLVVGLPGRTTTPPQILLLAGLGGVVKLPPFLAYPDECYAGAAFLYCPHAGLD